MGLAESQAGQESNRGDCSSGDASARRGPGLAEADVEPSGNCFTARGRRKKHLQRRKRASSGENRVQDSECHEWGLLGEGSEQCTPL